MVLEALKKVLNLQSLIAHIFLIFEHKFCVFFNAKEKCPLHLHFC
jgi:hypothetical protein